MADVQLSTLGAVINTAYEAESDTSLKKLHRACGTPC